MTAKDQQKIIEKGFRIIRVDLFRMKIKYKNIIQPEWATLEDGFKTKKEILERMKELLTDRMTIEE